MKRPSKRTTRKTTARKETWQAIRRRYTWHLRQPFAAEFDHSHWWEGQTKPEPSAALYELARRHPLVGETPPERILPPGREPLVRPPAFLDRPSLRWTQRLGMKSWRKLTKMEQSNWKSSVSKMKGFDFRPKDSLCRNITSLTRLAIIQQRDEAHKAFADCVPQLSGYPSDNLSLLIDPTDREWEEAIAQYAVEVHRQDYILLGVAPDLAANKAGAILAAQYRIPLRIYHRPKPRERARWESWLPIIAEFEDAELQQGGAKSSQVFARYRRVVDGIRFT